MKALPLLACGLAFYLLALLASAPATVAGARLQSASAGTLRLVEAQGSLWRGSGRLELRDASGRTAVGRRISWRWTPMALLRARLAYDIELAPIPNPFSLSVGWSQLEMGKAEIELPARVLGYAVPRMAALAPTGELRLRINRMAFSRGGVGGSGQVHWSHAGSGLSPVSPMGDYLLHFDGDGPLVLARLETLGGPLQLDGEGAWPRGGKPVFLAHARVPATLETKLQPFLRLVAVQRPDGDFEWRLP